MIFGAGRPGNRGGGDDHVGPGQVPGQCFGLLGAFVLGQFAGVTAFGFGIDPGIDHLRAQRFDLLAGGGADIVGLDLGTQPARRGNGLQSRPRRRR
jgi:hypothetical protein